MDGLSIFQAVIGGLQVIGKISETISDLRDAPDAIRSLLLELSTTRRILEQLKPFVLSDQQLTTEGAQHVEANDLILIFTDLVKTLSTFDVFINQVARQAGLKGSAFFKNTLWLRRENEFQRNLTRLQYQKSSLSVVLSLLDRKEKVSDRETLQAHSRQLNELRDELKQQTQIIQNLSPQTFAQMQSRPCSSHRQSCSTDATSLASTTLRRQTVLDDSLEGQEVTWPETDAAELAATTFRPERQMSTKSTALTDLDRLLFNQRPYLKVKRPLSALSLNSAISQQKHVAWSWISTFSLSEVSNISVLELPIQESELYNSHLWSSAIKPPPRPNSPMSTYSEVLVNPHDDYVSLLPYLFRGGWSSDPNVLAMLQESRQNRFYFNKSILQSVDSLMTFAVIDQHATDRYETLEGVLKEIKSIYEDIGSQHPMTIDAHAASSICCSHENHSSVVLGKAEKILTQSIDELRRGGEDCYMHCLVILLSEFLLDQSKARSAEYCLVRGIETCNISRSQPPLQWLKDLSSTVNKHQESASRAEEVLHTLVVEKSNSAMPLKLCLFFRELGWLRSVQGDHSRSEEMFLRALYYHEDFTNSFPYNTHVILGSIGFSCQKQGKTKRAVQFYLKALAAGKLVKESELYMQNVKNNSRDICNRLAQLGAVRNNPPEREVSTSAVARARHMLHASMGPNRFPVFGQNESALREAEQDSSKANTQVFLSNMALVS